MKRIVLIIMCLVLVITASSCQDKEVNANFYRIYSNNETLDDFGGENEDYQMEIDLKDTRIVFSLDKESEGNWCGELILYDNSEQVESIPINVVDKELVIKSETEKKVPISVLFFTQMDIDKCEIKESYPDVVGVPSTEEVVGTYPTEDMKAYMEMLYDEVISNLTKFDREDDYFLAINELDSFVFNRYRDSERDWHVLRFGFTGNEKLIWSDYGSLGDVSMTFTERCPIAWG